MQTDFSVDNVTIMSLNQMCDLALGFVHPGVIHFGVLHQILRAIIQQCQLVDIKVKVQGDKSVEMQKFTTASHRTSQVTIPSIRGPNLQSSSMTSFSVKGSVNAPTTPFEGKASIAQSKDRNKQIENDWMSGSNKDTNVIILDQSTNKPLEHTVSISVEQMQWIINSIEALQKQINEMKSFPNNQDILGAIRDTRQSVGTSQKPSETGSASQKQGSVRRVSDTPLVDMFQILSLTRRVDATEESISKLASLVEDLAREVTGGSKEQLPVESLSDLEGPIAALGNKNALELITKELKAMKLLIYGEGDDLGTTAATLQAKVASVEVRLKQMLDQVDVLDRSTSKQLYDLFGQCGKLEDGVISLEEKLEDSIQNQKSPIIALNERCNTMEKEIEMVKIEHWKMLSTNSQREMKITALEEQVEVLKITKVNVEEFEKALDSKLDSEKIMTKVSTERFDRTYDELKLNINEAIVKLTTQEEMWQKALGELQNELVTKMEKNELIALQEFVKGKLKMLRDKMKSMKVYQKAQEAAATKQSLLKNVKCLSCDADVATKTEVDPGDYPRSPTLPPTKTIAPYLAYELDVMRKQQRGLANSRNLHHFEATVRNKTDKIENRYCGGPHTLTTPVQRVTRLGHFLEQWGPEITTANETLIKGTDQKIYIGNSAQTVKSGQNQSLMTVEGDILKKRRSQHEDLINIPEKDPMTSDSEYDKRKNSGHRTSRVSLCK